MNACLTDPRRWEARIDARHHVGPFTPAPDETIRCEACGYYVMLLGHHPTEVEA